MCFEKWEVQVYTHHQWMNIWGDIEGGGTRSMQFDTQKEAEDLLQSMMSDLASAVRDGHITAADVQEYRVRGPVPKAPEFKVGDRFKLPGYKHNSATDLEMIVSYRYFNSTIWKYHCGLIVAKKGEPVPALYAGCQVRTIGDVQYVDYCTADDEEIKNERRK